MDSWKSPETLKPTSSHIDSFKDNTSSNYEFLQSVFW